MYIVVVVFLFFILFISCVSAIHNDWSTGYIKFHFTLKVTPI